MGRPPLGNLNQLTSGFRRELRSRIEALVGKNRMGQFLREAAENEALRREAAHGGGKTETNEADETDQGAEMKRPVLTPSGLI